MTAEPTATATASAWAPGMSTARRSRKDIHRGQSPSTDRVPIDFDCAQHPSAQRPGHYDDPDLPGGGHHGHPGGAVVALGEAARSL
ncbi:hypothetical protein GCM10018793_57100 [Streptomyces sulfonofaciens]|uniref:Uncharacterized protein n=1 Tax=Streptomyces sulfonofaciens TaxID=68272 RepID=A0A919GLI3_9ACTN|nr:hypothetical protein [Streptomyces sulfonofaciens]GHH86176.1 hypothetical protein GCM10018793_57100 [Streptomyces sulfonofaciens]